MASLRLLAIVSACLAAVSAGSSTSDPDSRPHAPPPDRYAPQFPPTEPYTVERSGLRRTVAAPYSPGQTLDYRGRVVHQQQDFRSHDEDVRMRTPANARLLFLERVKGSAIGIMFITYAYQHHFRFLSVYEGYKGALRSAAIPLFLGMTVLNSICAALAFFSASKLKRPLKKIMLLDGFLDIIAVTRNGAALLVNPITKWRTPGDLHDILFMNAM